MLTRLVVGIVKTCTRFAIPTVVIAVLLAALPILNLSFPPGHVLHISSYSVSLVGKFMCYAMAALAVDLVWGYSGILSLGHGVFFAIGGYAHGMYLMRAIGRDRNSACRCTGPPP